MDNNRRPHNSILWIGFVRYLLQSAGTGGQMQNWRRRCSRSRQVPCPITSGTPVPADRVECGH